jgi:hypothetical protein
MVQVWGWMREGRKQVYADARPIRRFVLSFNFDSTTLPNLSSPVVRLCATMAPVVATPK